ncbi:Cation-transporting ATPase, E1-E2 family [hydrothermal vent metagenome]|uniref:Cation-transporting ATPase, E1-E2 family n=1 Tax=hydrothermal vent metagenome TaxID=652676 RepID=A0A3B0ZY98_9ZZZZ
MKKKPKQRINDDINWENIPKAAHAYKINQLLLQLQTSQHGLSQQSVLQRLAFFGANKLPSTQPASLLRVFFRQFSSPLIYVLVAAALLSLILEQWSDAGFITGVLFINAIIGSFQEYSAQKAASALSKLLTTYAHVIRNGDTYEINAEQVVPGDIILLESGDRIPADIRLIDAHDLETDESLLTGESLAVPKEAKTLLTKETILAERYNMAFAGALVTRGRATGIVTATTLNTALGQIAADVINKPTPKAPLLVRMERFTQRVAITVALATVVMASIALFQGTALNEIFFLAVALAVSAIPEGLPVALTVALAIGMRRMSLRHVIVRRLIAVESLGSCTFIATDKTGTLTVNQLTVRRIVLANGDSWSVSGEGMIPIGKISFNSTLENSRLNTMLSQICDAASLPNEAFLGQRDGHWTHHGSAVDVALLVMAHKANKIRTALLLDYPVLNSIPFESERRYSASLHRNNNEQIIFVKGAIESLLPMCTSMMLPDNNVVINSSKLKQQAHELASQGYRVLALAMGSTSINEINDFSQHYLINLTFLGLICMIDPLRAEAKDAINRCRQAGIQVAILTGDHPATALAIGKELNLIDNINDVVTGSQLANANDNKQLDAITRETRVYARVEPHQKLDIVNSLQRNGHFVAVSGDGANDAPALKSAQVGVAMGQAGTDVAKETASIIITDDNFSSIVAGIEEGRIAYANVRKVIFLLISTGAAELILFTLALLTSQPLPLLAVQLLWLNLVTNGIQDIALAFEPGEGNELSQAPRSPSEPIFNRIMIERVILSATTIGITAFLLFQWLLKQGFTIDEARNSTLLLMVLFENIHVLNCRSETQSIFLKNPLTNPILLLGTIAAQTIHIAAMYTPWLNEVLNITAVSIDHWLQLLMMATTVMIIIEIHKLIRRAIN